MSVTLNVNGKEHILDAENGTPLLWVLRDILDMKGTKFGCGVAQCGACTVLVNGSPIRSCVTPYNALEGTEIETIEGKPGKAADAVRAAWEKIDVPQCGYCQSGQILAATSLLERNSNPTDSDIDVAMSGNICRCNSYMSIRRAIKDAADNLV